MLSHNIPNAEVILHGTPRLSPRSISLYWNLFVISGGSIPFSFISRSKSWMNDHERLMQWRSPLSHGGGGGEAWGAFIDFTPLPHSPRVGLFLAHQPRNEDLFVSFSSWTPTQSLAHACRVLPWNPFATTVSFTYVNYIKSYTRLVLCTSFFLSQPLRPWK